MTSDIGYWDPFALYTVEPAPLETDIYETGCPTSASPNYIVDPQCPEILSPTCFRFKISSPSEPGDSDSAIDSAPGSPCATVISVSATFHPGCDIGVSAPDLVLLSSDAVYFYVHCHILSATSSNNFNCLLPCEERRGAIASASPDPPSAAPIVAVPESSTVLNIVLHTIYNMSCSHYSPSFNDICAAIASLQTYGIELKAVVSPSMPLFSLLLYHIPIHPMDAYALAAHYDLYSLAAAASSHLLSCSLVEISDEMAERLGPLYLKRLFVVHLTRVGFLKQLVQEPPRPHAPTLDCDLVQQQKLRRAWALASACLIWDVSADIPTSAIESTLGSLKEKLLCDACRAALADKVKNIVVEWTMMQVSAYAHI
ncbi:hypothetical protein PLICRDRAFT_51932 [Plicaturopsis crispa FD-325 SS-3]|nr:hypothetical protein PLICRDRAFT_51932 [Plicaturopsis crispa FD-325 SS-3]